MRARLGLALLLGGALALRVALAVAERRTPPAADAIDYHRHAASIAAGHGFPDTFLAAGGGPSALRPPAYPYLLGLVYDATGATLTPARLLGALLGTVTVGLVFFLADAVWGRRVAWIAGSLAALAPSLVALSGSLVSESLFVPLELGVLAAALVARRAARPLPWAVLTGALCGAAALTRVVGLLLVVPALIAVWPTARRAGRAWSAPLAVVAAAAVAVVPWTVRNTIEFDQLVLVSTQGGVNVAGTYNEVSRQRGRAEWVPPNAVPATAPLFARRDLDEAELSDELTRRGTDYAREHPGHVATALGWNLLRMLDLDRREPVPGEFAYREMGVPSWADPVMTAWGLVLAGLALLGACAIAVRRAVAAPWFVWLVPVLVGASTVWVLGSPRYRVPLDPFLVLLAAVGIAALLGWLSAPASGAGHSAGRARSGSAA